jgi:hypothetical protein
MEAAKAQNWAVEPSVLKKRHVDKNRFYDYVIVSNIIITN